MSDQTFAMEMVWLEVMALFSKGLDGCDVQPVSENDFEGDDLVLSPPSVRVFFAGCGFSSTSDSQRLSYEVVGRFVAICGDEDRTSLSNQALASLAVATSVVGLIAGARIQLPDGQLSEPVTLTSLETVGVKGLGAAYAVGFEVPGLAQYLGLNAYPEAS